MSSPYASPVQSVAIRTVQESWHEANVSRYLWPNLTQVRTLGLRTMHSGITTYPISALDNSLLKTGNGRSWRPGQDIPAARALGSDTVTINLASEGNDPVYLPIPQGGDVLRLADAKSQAQQHLAQLYSRRDQVAIQLMLNNTHYGNGAGAALAWSGTQVLSAVDTSGDQDPIGDIDAQGDLIRYWATALGLKYVAVLDRKTASVLSRKPDYHGSGRSGSGSGGSGGNTPGKLSDLALVDILKATHGFEEVHITDLPMDSVALGQTSAPGYIASTPFFWMGLWARGNYDLRTDSSKGPDGAMAFAWEFFPFVDTWKPDGKETQVWMGKDALAAFNIRGSSMGRCLTTHFV